jgi:hypothetical protein
MRIISIIMHSGKVGEEPEELALRRGGGGAVA